MLLIELTIRAFERCEKMFRGFKYDPAFPGSDGEKIWDRLPDSLIRAALVYFFENNSTIKNDAVTPDFIEKFAQAIFDLSSKRETMNGRRGDKLNFFVLPQQRMSFNCPYETYVRAYEVCESVRMIYSREMVSELLLEFITNEVSFGNSERYTEDEMKEAATKAARVILALSDQRLEAYGERKNLDALYTPLEMLLND